MFSGWCSWLFEKPENSYSQCRSGKRGESSYFPSYKAFLKIKKRSGTSPPALFSARFIKKNMCVVIVCFPGCDIINFEINQDKNLNVLRSKRAFKILR